MIDFDALNRAYELRSEAIRHAADALKAGEIARVCARYELESDEFRTREEKAKHENP
jgi:hypothetical protein